MIFAVMEEEGPAFTAKVDKEYTDICELAKDDDYVMNRAQDLDYMRYQDEVDDDDIDELRGSVCPFAEGQSNGARDACS